MSVPTDEGGSMSLDKGKTQERTAQNTDRELYRDVPGDYYANSLHVTEGGGIGINVGGRVIVKPLAGWHALAASPDEPAPTSATPYTNRLNDLDADTGIQSAAQAGMKSSRPLDVVGRLGFGPGNMTVDLRRQPDEPAAVAPPTRPAGLDVEGLLELCAKATPGPWERVADAVKEPRWTHIEGIQTTGGRLLVADADFAIAARTALPLALQHILALEAEIAGLLSDGERR